MTCLKRCLILVCLFMIPFIQIQAKVLMPSIFSNHMVLQQKTQAAIWGQADANSLVKITTSWNKKTYEARADAQGQWQVKVSTPSYGGPYTIDITQGNTVQLSNVLIGEVWLCSGQSNMEMPLAGWGKINQYQEEIDQANYPKIRLLQAIRRNAIQPQQELVVRNSGWDICTPQNIAEFSAVAYFFAREIYKKTGMPIGLIHSSYGGTIAEAWTSNATLQTLPDFAKAAQKIQQSTELSPAEFELAQKNWLAGLLLKDPGFKNGQAVWAAPNLSTQDWKTMTLPGEWGTKGFANFDGAVWFQKKISLDDAWLGGDLIISLGAIDDEDISFFNGEQIGATKGFSLDRRYTIPARLVKKGENVITVRVYDAGRGGGFTSDESVFKISSTSGSSLSLSGDWKYKIAFSLADMEPQPMTPNAANRPTVLFNAMIHPIIRYAIAGVIWYQGESNAGRAAQYQTLFPALIQDWRRQFQQPKLPFYFVQLASFTKRNEAPVSSDWAELREAQLMATRLPHTGMAVAIDVGDALDIHPKNKQAVGQRLALIALKNVYKFGNGDSGPLYQSYKKVGDKMILNFQSAKGLKASSGTVKGFSIAGADQKFYWANASIKGQQVIVSAPEVKDPKAVRYGWSGNPEVNLVNELDLPASPFRTDSWKGVTFGVK